MVLPKYRTVIFVHGCFWHGHKDCKYFIIPKTRTEWWTNKINGNQKNDARKKLELNIAEWNVIEVFECELKKDKLDKTINKIVLDIKKAFSC